MAEMTDGQVVATPMSDLLARPVRRKLHRLGGLLRRRLLGEAGAWIVLTIVGLVLATLLLDLTLRLDRSQRIIVMGFAYVALAWVVWRQLLRPLAAPMGLADLALLVERAYPQLESRLISTVRFAMTGVPAGASRAMVAAMADEAHALVEPLDFRPIVERRHYRQMVRLAGCAMALLVGLAIWQGSLLKIWAQRNLAFAQLHWPQQTYLAVGQEDYTVLRGDDLSVIVEVVNGSQAPAYITVHARYPSVGWTEARVEPSGDGRQFVVQFSAVSESFEFYVVGGDDRRDRERPHNVFIVDPPSLRTVAFTIEYPTYARRAAVAVEGSAGMMIVPVGGTIVMEGQANKDLESGYVTLQGELVELMTPLDIRRVGSEDGQPGSMRGIVGHLQVDVGNEPSNAMLQFHMADTQGYTSRHGGRYIVKIEADQAPHIELRKFGVGETITPNAIIPLAIEATDDYGMVWGGSRCVINAETPRAIQTDLDWPAGQGPLPELGQEVFIDLQGRDVQVGQSVSLSVEMADSLPDDMGGPNVGSSETITLRIVSPQELLTDLVLQQKSVRLEFLQTIEQQVATHGLTEMLAEQAGTITPELRTDLGEVAARQQAIGANLAKYADRLDGVWQEMTYNRLGQAEDRDELADEIVAPLRDLVRRSQDIAGSLDLARQETSPEVLQSTLLAAATQQDFLRRAMEAILERMEKLQSRQDLANQLQMIINWNRDIAQDIRERINQQTGGIWEERDPSDAPDDEEETPIDDGTEDRDEPQ